MKATQRDFAGMAVKAAQTARLFFFCGPDEAGAQDAAAKIHSLLADPGERIELSGGDLRRDPVLLGDEARSNSLFGDTRHIIVHVRGDEAYEAVDVLLAGEAEPCPVLIIATGATDKSRTAKLLAGRGDALVAMFYAPDVRAVTGAVRGMADSAGLRIGTDIAERIAKSAGLDTRLAQSEITKLALFLDASPESPRTADAQALDAIGARTEDDGFAPLVNAVLGGQSARIADELRRIREIGLNPVGVLLAVERRVAQLAGLAAQMDGHRNVAAFMETDAGRRIFFRDKADITAQLTRWQGAKLERLVDKLTALHRQLMRNSQFAETLLAQGLAEITRAAARKAS